VRDRGWRRRRQQASRVAFDQSSLSHSFSSLHAAMTHVEEIAGNLEKMPPKSTYFYPKLLSGLVLNPLKGN
jgi:uncharacterized protein (DUF1015 family)